MGSARVVWLAALAAFLSRFPSLLWPLRPDEAGFLLVARSWNPEPDSVYGHYWVDRPPPVIWLIKASDALIGPYAHRFVAAVGCALLVLAAAAAARELACRVGGVEPAVAARAASWTAVATAALVANAEIDAVAAKGELFGIPLVMAGCWLALRAVRRSAPTDAFVAGLLSMTAVGMKQSIVGGLVFGGVLLVGSALARQLPWRDAVRCAAAATAGAAVPVAVVVGWALWVGVRLETLWYVVVTFRSDASAVIASQNADGATGRIWVLLLVFLGTGMALLLLWFVVRLRDLVRHDAVATLAVAAMVVVDLVAAAASGSFWLPYLFVPIPGLALALALLLSADAPRWQERRAKLSRIAVGLVVVASALSLVGWTAHWARGAVPVEVRTGRALADAARPGDRVLVYGGRADIQWASGATSPYPYLWSLPMRTLDPGLVDLDGVLNGANPPTWFVEATYVNRWSELGTRPIERSLISKYTFVRTACERYRIYRLNTVDPIDLDVDCSTPWRTIWGD